MIATIRKVPLNYSVKWMSCAWLFVRAYYKPCLIMGLIGVSILVGASLIPLIGRPLSIFVSPMVAIGFLFFSEKMHRGEVVNLETVIKAVKDRDLVKSLVPIYIAYAVLMIPEYIAPNVSAGLGILVFFLGLAIEATLIFGVPLVYFRKMEAVEAMKLSFHAAVANAGPLIAFYALGFFITAFAALLLAIPLVFAVLPAWVSLRYLQYKSIFDGLDLPALERELEDKLAVATLKNTNNSSDPI